MGKPVQNPATVSSRGLLLPRKDVKEARPVKILLTLPNEITLAGSRPRSLPRPCTAYESRDETSSEWLRH